MKRYIYFLAIALITGLAFTACGVSDSDSSETAKPTIEGEAEIGLGNNAIGVIGRDFHFEMEVLAGELLENVQIHIEPRSGETYAHDWSYEVTWDQYSGVKNATVHKHFDIPEDAAEGAYDFIITVNDQNGTKLEEVKTITIYLPENLPVDPQLEAFNISKNFDFFYRNEEFLEDNQFIKNDTLSSQVAIGGVKGDGIMYLLLINKALNHRPESIEEIDFSKVIVYDVFEHENEEEVYSFSNAVFDSETFTWIRQIPHLTIGATNDNNAPEPHAIDGDKAWKNGDYYFGIIYKNTTHNQTLFNYIELKIEGF